MHDRPYLAGHAAPILAGTLACAAVSVAAPPSEAREEASRALEAGDEAVDAGPRPAHCVTAMLGVETTERREIADVVTRTTRSAEGVERGIVVDGAGNYMWIRGDVCARLISCRSTSTDDEVAKSA